MSKAIEPRPKLPASLKLWKYEIERIGKKYGLDFYPNIIVMADHEEISELAAYSGYPVRYHHWFFGQESIKLKKSYRWGLHIIYEMVIPTIPCYSYFLDANPEVTQKAVIAHACIGHNDFFKNNAWFRDIPRNLHHRFGDNAEHIETLRLEIGTEKVNKFLEACMSLDNLFNLLGPIIIQEHKTVKTKTEKRFPKRIKPRDELPFFMDPYINPPEYLERERKKIEQEEKREADIERKLITPPEPVRDILYFLMNNAPLEKWQREVIRIVREESLCLAKGGQTKIMNEGWAAFWEAKIMAGEGVAVDSEVCSFAKTFAGVQHSGRFKINPYCLGKQLWDDIKFRWDTGRLGEIWNKCKDGIIKDNWEEFIVFKSLYDEFGGMTEEATRLWNEFSTLVHETRENKGWIKKAFFLPEDWISEWLKYREAETKLPALEEALEYIKKLEEKYRSERNDSLAPLATRHKIMLNSLSPFAFWGSDELGQEIAGYRFYLNLRTKLANGEVPIHNVEIPEQWIGWAGKYQFLGRLGQGYEKIFEVRAVYNDVNFIQDFFNQDFCDKYSYYTFGIGKSPPGSFWGEDRLLIKSRNFIRVRKLLIEMCLNLGQPKIVLLDANFNNNSELRFVHLYDGRDTCYNGCADCGRAGLGIKEVLERLYLVWNKDKPVHLETVKTAWPKKKPPWFYWFPTGYTPSKSGIEKPTRRWVRYTYNGKNHIEAVVGKADIHNWEAIKKLLPVEPELT
ncbi:MAG: SpoVR family protein [Candidatus Yanofskybacteria bacterium]|nr:SpoVR family protein [Candidatus Yanofskybacteria bacterium]